MNALIEYLNLWGERAVNFAWPMLWQSSVLIAVLFAFDFAFRRKMRASVRYALWLVVLIKLLLPPSLALPTSLAWWVRPSAPPIAAPKQEHYSTFLVSYSDIVPTTIPMPVATRFEPPPEQSLSPGGWALLSWVLMCAGLLAWLLARWRQVARDVRRATLVSKRLRELLREAQIAARVSRSIELRLTTRAMSPAVCGLFHPVILLPQSLVARLTSERLRAVLLHELIHLRRGDVWVNCLQAMLQIVYWWHPLFWLANARIRRVREEAVDDAVMLTLAGDAETYAPTLIEVAKLAFNRPLASLGLVGILESRSALRQRIERLMDFHPPKAAGVGLASVLCTLTFAALAVPMAERPINSLKRNTQDKLAEQRSNNANLTAISNFIGEFKVSGEKADSDVTFDPDTGIATASNGASVRYRGVTITADRIVVDSRAKTITADGHVRLARDANAGERSLGDHMLLTAEGETVTVKGSNFRSTGTAAESAFVPEFTATIHAPHSNETKGATQVSTQKQTRFASPPVELSNENEEVKLRMIVLNKLVTSDAVQKRKLAEDIIAEVRGGAAFSEMASVFSEDRQGRQGGDWGWVGKRDGNGTPVLRKELADVAFSLQPGEVSGVIETPEVICLMLVEDKRPVHIKALSAHFRSESNSPPDNVSATNTSRPDTLYTRTFKVNPNTFLENLRVVTEMPPVNPSGDDLKRALTNFFATLGVDVQPPHSIFYNERNGLLLVRSTMSQLDVVEQAVQVLNVAPDRIKITARFVEMPEEVAESIFDEMYLTNRGSPANWSVVLPATEMRRIVNRLEVQEGVDLLTMPEVTTLSGRQAQVQAVDMRTVFNGINLQALVSRGNAFTNETTNSIYQAQTMPFGATLDVVPYVSADGYTIQMTVIPSLTEFLGYDDPGAMTGLLPLPMFRIRQVTISAIVWDGQTMLLGNPTDQFIFKKRDGTVETTKNSEPKRKLFVFVTPRLVDESGNPIHTDGEMPFAKDSIPPQTSHKK